MRVRAGARLGLGLVLGLGVGLWLEIGIGIAIGIGIGLGFRADATAAMLAERPNAQRSVCCEGRKRESATPTAKPPGQGTG